jgi:hypothetical protein
MLLFIDADCSKSTGWEGYDYLVNSPVLDDHTTTISRYSHGKWEVIGKVSYKVSGNKLMIKVPRSLLGLARKHDFTFDFHWADNIQKLGDITEFSLNGDSAPDGRFNYRFTTVR